MPSYRIEIEDDESAILFKDNRYVQEFDELDDAERHLRHLEGRGAEYTLVDVDGYRDQRRLR